MPQGTAPLPKASARWAGYMDGPVQSGKRGARPPVAFQG
jgi:hypothetical protein